MTCAVRGYPAPTVSWYLNDICINSDNNYYITNSFGVCSLYILRVRPKDSGEYKVVAVNSFGKAECSAKIFVRGKLYLRLLLYFCSLWWRVYYYNCFAFFPEQINWQQTFVELFFLLRSCGKYRNKMNFLVCYITEIVYFQYKVWEEKKRALMQTHLMCLKCNIYNCYPVTGNNYY